MSETCECGHDVDPCGQAEDPKRWVYLHIGAGGEALYVGCTQAPSDRTRQHRRTAIWWPLVADIAVIGPFCSFNALLIEQEFIGELSPIYNKQRGRRRTAAEWVAAS